MYARSILLSSLFMLMSIAPLWAQYSFKLKIGATGYDKPFGMKQARDGYYYVYGQSSTSLLGNVRNYVAKIDHLGNIIWQRTFTNKSTTDNINDLIELPDGTLFCGGRAQGQLQELNVRVTLIRPNGDIILDTLYPHSVDQAGYIIKMVNNADKNTIVSIGFGAPDRNTTAMLFQRTDYAGKRLFYTFVPYPEEFRIKKLFKIKDKDEYILFGKNRIYQYDSIGNVTNYQWAVDTSAESVEIHDVVQNEGGSFTCLVHRWVVDIGGYYLQHNDSSGKFVRYSTRITNGSGEYVYETLTATRNKGFFAAGNNFTLVDSNEQIKWQKDAGSPRGAEFTSVGQASDGGFYGSAIDWSKDDALDPACIYTKRMETV